MEEVLRDGRPPDDGSLLSSLPDAGEVDEQGKPQSDEIPAAVPFACLPGDGVTMSSEVPDSATTSSGHSSGEYPVSNGDPRYHQEIRTHSPLLQEQDQLPPSAPDPSPSNSEVEVDGSDSVLDTSHECEEREPSATSALPEEPTTDHAYPLDGSGAGRENVDSPVGSEDCVTREEGFQTDGSTGGDPQTEESSPQGQRSDDAVIERKSTESPENGCHGDDKLGKKESGDVYSTVISPQRAQRHLSPMNTISLEEELEMVECTEEVRRKKYDYRTQLLRSAGITLQGAASTSSGTSRVAFQDTSPESVGAALQDTSSESVGADLRDSSTSPSESTSIVLQDSGTSSSGSGGTTGERTSQAQVAVVVGAKGRVRGKTEDRNLEELSEILLDSDSDGSDVVSSPVVRGEGSALKVGKRVWFADEVRDVPIATEGKVVGERKGVLSVAAGTASQAVPTQTPPSLLGLGQGSERELPKHPGVPVSPSPTSPRRPIAPHLPFPSHSDEDIVSGVEYSAEYLGSTSIFLTGSASKKTARMQQAQDAVKLIKDPENDSQPRFSVKVKISTESIRIADSQTDVDLMDHPLHTITYVADIANVLVIMALREQPRAEMEPGQSALGAGSKDQSTPGVASKDWALPGEKSNEQAVLGAESKDQSAPRAESEDQAVPGAESEDQSAPEAESKDQVTPPTPGAESEDRKLPGAESKDQASPGAETKDHPALGAVSKDQEAPGAESKDREEGGAAEDVPRPIPKMKCHVLESENARQLALVIGQAFSVAYKEFLRANGISEEALEEEEYAHVLNAQSVPQAELESLQDQQKTKKMTFPKTKGDPLGIMVMESGYGSAIPACVIAKMSKTGAAAKSGLLNVGDHIISLNGVSLVGMPLKTCIEQIKKCRHQNLVKLVVCSCPAVVDVTIVRPDLKFQLGFSVKEAVIVSLMRGSIAERSGIRVGHRIIEINGTSTVRMHHADVVTLLCSIVGDVHLRTMPFLMYRLITGQAQPEYH